MVRSYLTLGQASNLTDVVERCPTVAGGRDVLDSQRPYAACLTGTIDTQHEKAHRSRAVSLRSGLILNGTVPASSSRRRIIPVISHPPVNHPCSPRTRNVSDAARRDRGGCVGCPEQKEVRFAGVCAEARYRQPVLPR